MIKPRVISYAQNREDLILQGFFKNQKTGFYVDVGAEAPTDLSVTKIFYDMGWSGVNIEPIKKLHQLFVNERPRDINLNIGVSDREQTMSFREYEGTGYSTFSDAMKKEHLDDTERYVKKYTDYDVRVRKLSNVLKELGNPKIDFMKIDVEGLEYEVIAGNDWSTNRPEVICIEANHIKHDWRKFLIGKGYTKVFFDGLNEYYTDNNTNRAKKFNYIDAIIYKEPIVNFRLLEDFDEYDKVVAWLDGDKKSFEAELVASKQALELSNNDAAALRKELESLRQFISERITINGRLRHLILDSVRQLDVKITRSLSRDMIHTPPKVKLGDGRDPLQKAAISDKENLHLYIKEHKPSLLLPYYIAYKKGVVWILKKVRSVIRRIRR